jgi:hypothetical protein
MDNPYDCCMVTVDNRDETFKNICAKVSALDNLVVNNLNDCLTN